MKLNDLRNIGIEKLKKENVEDAKFKIDILLQYILNMNKTDIIINSDIEIENNIEKKFYNIIGELINGKPIQYITNSQEFMNLKFYVDENVLIPQPDTEIIVEKSIEILEQLLGLKKEVKILDLCTGSGAIAVAIENYVLNRYNNSIEIYASDISEKALEIAKINAKENNKNSKIIFIKSDMFNNINQNDFDIIISNPPYIETDTIPTLSKEVQNEPHIALDGGEDGLKFYKIISEKSPRYLRKNGYILLEIGYNQKKSVKKLLDNNNFYNIECIKDLAGNDRVLIAQNLILFQPICT